MCGIAGAYNWKFDAIQQQQLLRKLHHRGPDGNGVFEGDHVTLLHTRLSILELSDLGAQPYYYENLVLIFNGELYNYQEVRKELIKVGYSFQSNADTEVLIKAFHCWREQAINHFIGMFAFAIYDVAINELYLFRDRVGVKPLYYIYNNNNKLAFASEIKALSLLAKSKEIDKNALVNYFRFGYTSSNQSIYRSILKLEPGHFITINNYGLKHTQYWRPRTNPILNKTEPEWLAELETLLVSAFRYRMVADVPVGIFLSGGIDSSLLAAMLKKHYGNINSFTVGFEESKFDESTFSRIIAKHLDVEHTDRILQLKDAKEIFQNFYEIYDEPFADISGIPTSFVTKLAKEYGMKVVLSADGGDELFGGYSHYNRAFSLFLRIQRIPYRIRKLLVYSSKKLITRSLRVNINFFNFEHKLYSLEELLLTNNLKLFFESVIANQAIVEIENLLNFSYPYLAESEYDVDQSKQALLMWDFNNYLPNDLLVKVDGATMYHSMECREPFLDHRLVELSCQMPIDFKMKNGIGKYPLRKLLSKYIPSPYFERRKQGFSIPLFEWFKEELDASFEDYFSDESLNKISYLNKAEVQREFQKYRINKKNNKDYNIEKMWRLLSYLMWNRKANV
jgi:asparagine synthase (glutamine-hydrolysing)